MDGTITDKEAEEYLAKVLQYLNEDPEREGLVETPKRYLKFMKEFLSPPDFKYTSFQNEGTDDMIVQKNIPFFSLCEHHIAPFFGVCHVAYIPNGKIVGLSKLARHLCMAMRGVKKHGVTTTTSKMMGIFFDESKTRNEFMQLIK